MRLLVVFLVMGSVGWGQAPAWPNSVVTNSTIPFAVDHSSTTLTTSIGPSDLVIPVATSGPFAPYQVINIDLEQIQICGTAPGQLQVCGGGRGYAGTNTVSHIKNSFVLGYVDSIYHNTMFNEIHSMESWLSTNGLQDPGANGVIKRTGKGIAGGTTGIATAADLNNINSGAGAILRPVASRLNESFSVKDYGADGTGGLDATAAFNAAVSAAAGAGGGRVTIPCGVYSISGTVSLTNTAVSLEGENEWCAVLKTSGAGPVVKIQMNPFGVEPAAYYGNFNIQGFGAVANGIGLQTGCIVGATFDHIGVTGFNGTSGIGIDVEDNLACNPGIGGGWTERNTWTNVQAGGYPAGGTTLNNTTGWKFQITNAATNVSFGYNRFLNVQANVHSGQTGFWFGPNIFLYNSQFSSICNMDDGSTFTTPPVCILVDGNVGSSGNIFQLNGEYQGVHSASSVVVDSNAGMWGGGVVAIFDQTGNMIPPTYAGGAHQQPVARFTPVTQLQAGDLGTGTLNGVSVTPSLIGSDLQGITNFGYFTGANIASPFVSLFSPSNNQFSVCSLGFNEAVNNCANSVNTRFRVDNTGTVSLGAPNIGSARPTTFLFPSYGAPDGFLMGLGMNCYWDGGNWHFRSDGSNNGGACVTGNNGFPSGPTIFSIPSLGPGGSGATDQTISNGNLANHAVATFAPIGSLVALAPTAFSLSGYNAGASISEAPSSIVAGGINLFLPATGAGVSGDHYNQSECLGDTDLQACLGVDVGANIAHPFLTAYSADPTDLEVGETAFKTPYSSANYSFKVLHGGVLKTGTSGATITVGGNGVPGGSCTSGSLYTNASGAGGTTLYVCVSSSWSAVTIP